MADYRLLLIVPIALLLVSVITLVNGYAQTGEWFDRSVELKGGTQITIAAPDDVDIGKINSALAAKWNAKARLLNSFSGQIIQVETDEGISPQEIMEELENLGLDTSEPSIESFGPSVSEGFWYQAQIAIVLAFIFMGIIVFFIFRTLVPSMAVMMAAMSDIVVTLAVMNILGIELSLAGLAAILMLIGYSIDTDILLTTRLIKDPEEARLKDRLIDALYTGLTMSITTLGALGALIIMDINPVLTQIATILVIGLAVDIINTWLQNSVLLRWHCERRGLE